MLETATWIITYLGGPAVIFEAIRRGLKWGVGHHVNGKIETVDAKVDGIKVDIADVKSDVREVRDRQIEVSQRVSRLEGRADILK